MKILVVTPWAPGVTRPRSLGLIKHLAEHHEVVVIGAAWNAKDVEELRQLPVKLVVPVRLKKPMAYLRCFVGLLKGHSLQQSYVDSRAFRLAMRKTVVEFGPDLGFFNVIRTAQFSNELNDIPLVIDLDEFRSAYYELLSKTSRNPLWRVVAKIEARRMREAEERALTDFDTVIVSSPTDLSERGSKVRLVRSPHTIETHHLREPLAKVGGQIVFVGRQSYRANAEAIKWFVREVMPGVLRRVPSARLSIVGDAPPQSTRQLESPNISVTGRVNDVAAHYASASVSIIPVTMATGVQMKLIESMFMGTPVVATPIVARGAGIDERHCFIAQTADEWATRVVQVLTDEAASRQMSQSAKRWADREYSRNSITRSLDKVLAEVLLLDELEA